MSKEYLKSLIDCVSGIECKHETQQIAKYELIEYVEDLQQRIDKAIEILKLCNSQCAKETIEILGGLYVKREYNSKGDKC